jgi:hypothetical protein
MRTNGTYEIRGVALSDGKGSTKSTSTRRKHANSVPVLNLNNFKDGKLTNKPANCKASGTMSPEFSSSTAYTISPQEWR